ncbi:hypothetical protein BJX99DRAFT_84655 [Aspergillus californicus]
MIHSTHLEYSLNPWMSWFTACNLHVLCRSDWPSAYCSWLNNVVFQLDKLPRCICSLCQSDYSESKPSVGICAGNLLALCPRQYGLKGPLMMDRLIRVLERQS